jgi:hypothetical protein
VLLEHSNKPPGSLKGRDFFFDQMSDDSRTMLYGVIILFCTTVHGIYPTKNTSVTAGRGLRSSVGTMLLQDHCDSKERKKKLEMCLFMTSVV